MSLKRIILRDFVIVSELDLELASGFTVLTGETGAGKSILVDALQLVTGGRADVALVTRSYLSDYLLRNEKVADQLLVSQRIDQVYHHYAIIRPTAPITGEAFGKLLRGLRDNGQMLKIFQPYRIAVVPVPDS